MGLIRLSAIHPKSVKFTLAAILCRLHKWNLSIPLLKSCIKSSYKLDKSSQKLLYAYRQLGKQEEGFNFLIRNILDNNDKGNGYFILGMAFRSIKDWSRARVYFKQALDVNPNNERIMDRYIRTLYDGRYIDDLVHVLTREGDLYQSLSEDNYIFLYNYCLKTEQEVQAEKILDLGYRFTKQSGTGKLAFLFGKKLFDQEEWEKAETVLTNAKMLGEEKAERYIHLIKNKKVYKDFLSIYSNGYVSELKRFLTELEEKDIILLKTLLKNWCDDFGAKAIIAIKDKACYEYAAKHIENEPEFFALQVALYATLNNEKELRNCINQKVRQSDTKDQVYYLVARILRDQETYALALEYAIEALSLDKNNATITRLVSDLHHKLGNISKSMHYLDQEYKLRNSEEIKGQIRRKKRFLQGEYRFYQKQLRPFDAEKNSSYQGIENRVLHLHHNSIPYAGGGYAVRSRYIVKNLREQGVDAIIATRPGYPFDLGKGVREDANQSMLTRDLEVDIPVYRIAQHLRWKGTPVDEYIDQYTQVLEKVIDQLKPNILHPASNFFNGIAGAYVAKKYQIPLVYEVRGLWELTRGSLTEGYEGSERYEYMKFLEKTAMEQADHVVTISQGLKDEILNRGIPEEKITVIPNAVDCSIFKPLTCNHELKDKLGLKGKTIIGFIGTLTAYEGLELLLKAFKQIVDRRDDIRILIVGDGPILEQLKAIVENEQLHEKVVFTGRVPHEDVKEYYSIIDIFPFPRRNWPVCNIVTPLKPYEVMAMQKTLLVSDVEALKEMVIENETGLYFKADDVEDLTQKLLMLIDRPEYRTQLAQNARQWVLENRDWRHLAKQYVELYKRLLHN